MVCIGGSTGKCAIALQDVSCNQQINTATPNKYILSQYLYYLMETDYFYKLVRENATGTATPILNRSLWESLIIPISPYNEQIRICSQLEKILNNIQKTSN